MMSEAQVRAELNAKFVSVDWGFLYQKVKEGGSKQALSILTEAYKQQCPHCETLVLEKEGDEIIYQPISCALANLASK